MKGKLVIGIAVVLVLGIVGILGYEAAQPGPEDVVRQFLDAWGRQAYVEIYPLLSTETRAMYAEEELRSTYEAAWERAGLTGIREVEMGDVAQDWSRAEVSFLVELRSRFLGAWSHRYRAEMVREGLFDWRLEWSPQLVFPGVPPDGRVELVRSLPPRGQIFDRYGEPLAVEGTAVTVGVEPRRVQDPEELTRGLQEILHLDPDWVERQYTATGVQPDWFVPLRTLPEHEYARLRPELAPIPGVVFRRVSKRIYPQGQAAPHVVGYVGEVTREDIEARPGLDYRPGDLAGRAGLEATLETLLRGAPGYTLRAIGPEGERGAVIAERTPVPGPDIYLTLDMHLQQAAEEALGDQAGAIVAMNPATGEILALASRPGYDPNHFSFGLRTEEWEQIQADDRRPLFHRAVRGTYPPGSSFKLITAAAALDMGHVHGDSAFHDTGEHVVWGNPIRNFRREVFGDHTFADAVTHSINTTFAKIGLDVGAEALTDYSRRFGLEDETAFLVPLTSNTVPVATSRIGNPGSSPVDLAWTALGQARTLATPVQMARVAAVIANRGEAMQPMLVDRVREKDADGRVVRDEPLDIRPLDRVMQAEAATELTRLMQSVVERGTGKDAAIAGLDIAGKTGTAEIARGMQETHAWFVGFTPVDEPLLAFSVFVERGGVGGEVAAPIAREFLIQGLGVRGK